MRGSRMGESEAVNVRWVLVIPHERKIAESISQNNRSFEVSRNGPSGRFLPCKHDVQGGWACGVFGATIAERGEVDSGEEAFSAAKNQRGDGEMHVIDQSGLQVLPDGRRSAAEADVATACGFVGLAESGVDAVGNEVECGAAFHGDRGPGMVGEHEDRAVIGRLVSPPAFPFVVGPCAANWAKHVASENPCSDSLEAALGEIVIDAGRAILVSHHSLEAAGGEHPSVQILPADSKWVFQALLGTSSESVHGDAETMHTKFRHGFTINEWRRGRDVKTGLIS